MSDLNWDGSNVELENHNSTKTYKPQVEKELISQLQEGYYVCSSIKPSIVSPMGAIPKDSDASRIRLIHDGSRPAGSAMNDFSKLHSVRYQTLSDAVKLVKPGMFMAKIDLKNAYRSVPIHPSDYPLTGLKWKFEQCQDYTYMFDTRLCFGSRKGPMIFHRLSQAVRRMMIRRGFKNIVVYLDDFFLVGSTFDECNEALHVLMQLLRSLGFLISWPKVVGPSQEICFLGININSVDQALLLSKEKLQKLYGKLVEFQCRKRASKRQLEALAGLLNWCCQAIRGGSFFLRRILDTMNCLKAKKHKISLSSEFHKDVQWWISYLYTFNGKVFIRQFSQAVHVDACNWAAGMFFAGDWQYSVWKYDWPEASNLHINYKETLSVVLAARRWGSMWQNSSVCVHTDNSVTKAVINKGRSRNPLVMEALRELFWISEQYNFNICAIHVPGKVNMLPDSISRLHEKHQLDRFNSLMCNWFQQSSGCMWLFSVCCNMSYLTLLFLFPQLLHWILSGNFRQKWRNSEGRPLLNPP